MFKRYIAAVLAGLAMISPVEAQPRAQIDEGRAVYNFRCYFCHGYSGNAQTLAATYLSPPPTNFKLAPPDQLTPEKVLSTLLDGKPGTAMKSFRGVISPREMQAVANFVVDEFVTRKADNTRYHTIENGWPDHERYASAFPFAKGEIPLSQAWETLSEQEAAGKRLYLSSCVSCHDRGAPTEDEIAWSSRPLSYPRNNFSLAEQPKIDAMTSASPYALHDIPPKVKGLTAKERRGQRLFQDNCAFCHGADGKGQNWIGRFMEPPPRNLQDPAFMLSSTRHSLANSIREGLPNTSMPAWKSVLKEMDIQAILAYINRAFHPIADSQPKR